MLLLTATQMCPVDTYGLLKEWFGIGKRVSEEGNDPFNRPGISLRKMFSFAEFVLV